MFGNLITNRQLKRLYDQKVIQISNFESALLKGTHYTLRLGIIFRRDSNDKWDQPTTFRKESIKPFQLQGNEYVVVEPYENVILDDGFVGRFIPTSNLIEMGLGLVAGQVDAQYGKTKERLRFGLKNLQSDPISIPPLMRVAHLEFFDIRGLPYDDVLLTEDERLLRLLRRAKRAEDDGVQYPED